MGQEYYLKKPQEQMFYRKLAFILNVLGLGDQTCWGYADPGRFVNLFKKTVIFPVVTCIMLQIVYLYQNFNHVPFKVLSSLFSVIAVNALITFKVICSKQRKYKDFVRTFLHKHHVYNFLDEDDFTKTILIKVERKTRVATLFYLIFVIAFCVLWQIVPLMENVKNLQQITNKTVMFQTVIYMWMPFDYAYNFKNWLCIHVINIFAAIMASTLIIVMETVNFMVIFNLLGHVNILQQKIMTKFTGDLNDKEIEKRLDRLIDYHYFVIKTFKESEAAFGLNISANYLYNLIVDSFVIYMLVFGDESDKVMYGCNIITSIGTLVLISFNLEELHTTSEKFPDLIYNVNWENWSRSNQKSVLLILMQTQRVLRFKATGGMATGVEPMMSILKSTFSYYVYLKTTI